MDDQPTGSCVTCHRRDPHHGYACNPCRSRFRTWLGEIPDLYTQLLDEPLAPSGSPGKGGPVSGSRDRPIPIRVDLFDLTHTGGWPETLTDDQVGHLPVWTTLETWARDWSTYRAMGEAAERTVEGLCRWMWERVDDMCDEHPAIDEAFHDIRRLYGILRAQLGLIDPKPEQLVGVPCKHCGQGTLWRMPESEYAAECAIPDCQARLTEDDYAAWTRELADRARRRRILRSASPAA